MTDQQRERVSRTDRKASKAPRKQRKRPVWQHAVGNTEEGRKQHGGQLYVGTVAPESEKVAGNDTQADKNWLRRKAGRTRHKSKG